MLNPINTTDSLLNSSRIDIEENQGLASTEKIKSKAKNPYAKNDFLVDESDISQEAIKLYEKEKDIQKFKGILNQVSEEDANKQVASLIEKGIIDIPNNDLADSIMNDTNLIKDLF